jgi:hypothetical protein
MKLIKGCFEEYRRFSQVIAKEDHCRGKQILTTKSLRALLQNYRSNSKEANKTTSIKNTRKKFEYN